MKPCAREIEYMRLIPWIRHHGSEQVHLYVDLQFTTASPDSTDSL